jgi:hypothetical protein
VEGLAEAEAVPGVEEIDITLPIGHPIVPLPEGSSYLGFIFAQAPRPEEVEVAPGHRRLHFVIVLKVRLSPVGGRR